jgi:hypothetical protein
VGGRPLTILPDGPPPKAQDPGTRHFRPGQTHASSSCPSRTAACTADALIPYQHIERFMDQQAARGVTVHHHCWDDTAHCEHLRKHPEQYKSLVGGAGRRGLQMAVVFCAAACMHVPPSAHPSLPTSGRLLAGPCLSRCAC